MKSVTNKKVFYLLLLFLSIFIPLREFISYLTCDYVKFIPDAIIWGMLIFYTIKNKFKISLKNYDILFILFIGIGFISCIINSVSILAFALQVRSIGTMYVLFYLLREIGLEKTEYNKILEILAYINTIVIIIAIFEFLSNKALFFPQEWANSITYSSNLARTYSLMKNPNTFATYSFLLMVLFYSKCETNLKKIHLMYFLLVFIGILLSASRSTLIITIMFLLFLLIKAIYNKFFYNVIAMILVFIISFGIVFGLEQMKNLDKFHQFVSDIIYNEKDDIPLISKPENDKPSSDTNDNINSTPNNENTSPENNSGNSSNSDNTTNSNNSNSITNKVPASNGNITLLERWEEIATGVTMENSKYEGRIYNIKKGFEILKDYPIIGTGFGTYGSAGSMMITPKIYEKYNLTEKFYADNEYIKIIVETGIIGTMIFGAFCLTILYQSVKEKNLYCLVFQLFFFFIGLFYNVFELQVLCLLFYIGTQYLRINNERKNQSKKTNRKISFLALHLGTGGIEQAIINTANMLCNDYEVEIISLYKQKTPSAFKLNSKVNVKYLMNTISNRKELKESLKNRKIISFFKECLKAMYILVNKKKMIINSISQSDSDIIISTRYSFSKMLNDFGSTRQYKIHQEHTYAVDDKSINRLNSLKKIDCIMPCSKVLNEHYLGKIDKKLIYIPLSLDSDTKTEKYSKLHNKNIIAVGRLEKEKGFNDLLNVIYKLNDKDIFLNLFGDGSLMNQLKDQTKELGIEKQVKFWGFKDQKFIKEYMTESSLYVMTSHEESFGLVLIEAMNYGVPCIAYDSAEGAKYTINKENGYYIKNRNEKEMIKKIKEYFNLSQKDRNSMGIAARKSVEMYKYDTIKKKWLEFIQDVLEEIKNETVSKKNI